MKILFYGAKGWIATLFREFLYEHAADVKIIAGKARCDDLESVRKEVELVQPTHCVAFIGRTSGKDDKTGESINTIDYLELPGKLEENLRDNLCSQLVLYQVCRHLFDVHLTMIGTGCIFSYYDSDPYSHRFEEKERGNFTGSSYSTVKSVTDRIFNEIFVQECLYIRLRMPISDKDHPKNFLTKIIHYKKIYSTVNSMTVLSDAFPILFEWMSNQEVGVRNLVNPGAMSHDEILHLYKELVDPQHTYQNITEQEHDSLLKSKRSKNVLDTSALEQEFPHLRPLKDSIRRIFTQWKK